MIYNRNKITSSDIHILFETGPFTLPTIQIRFIVRKNRKADPYIICHSVQFPNVPTYMNTTAGVEEHNVRGYKKEEVEKRARCMCSDK